jgi:tRNA (guanosine-2'-O-)-methyltransferase
MDFSWIDGVIRHLGAGEVLALSAPFVSDARRRRIEDVVQARLSSLSVLVERPKDPRNAAAILRTAESLGVLSVHVVGAPDGVLHSRKTTQGADHWVRTHHHEVLSDYLAFHPREALLVAASMEGACGLDELPVDRPLVLAFGNEAEGLSPELRAACALAFRIPMYGMSESLNVSVSAAIALQAVTHARRAYLGQRGDLAGSAYLAEKARYYVKSLEPRLRESLFAR